MDLGLEIYNVIFIFIIIKSDTYVKTNKIMYTLTTFNFTLLSLNTLSHIYFFLQKFILTNFRHLNKETKTILLKISYRH